MTYVSEYCLESHETQLYIFFLKCRGHGISKRSISKCFAGLFFSCHIMFKVSQEQKVYFAL